MPQSSRPAANSAHTARSRRTATARVGAERARAEHGEVVRGPLERRPEVPGNEAERELEDVQHEHEAEQPKPDPDRERHRGDGLSHPGDGTRDQARRSGTLGECGFACGQCLDWRLDTPRKYTAAPGSIDLVGGRLEPRRGVAGPVDAPGRRATVAV